MVSGANGAIRRLPRGFPVLSLWEGARLVETAQDCNRLAFHIFPLLWPGRGVENP